MTTDTKRYHIYRGEKTGLLCTVNARDSKHALKVARQVFYLPRGAFAHRANDRDWGFIGAGATITHHQQPRKTPTQ